LSELYRITGPNFTAGLVIQDGRCTEAAPFLRRSCLGKPMGALRNLFAWRGWTYERVG